MTINTLARVDLNLLVALQVLLEELNVTRSAERLHVSQPAMSKTLLRLRAVFEDPLFTRSGRGLVPTPRALELKRALPQLLEGIGGLLIRTQFEPATYHGHVRIVAPEFMAVQVMPQLVRVLGDEAPGLCMAVSNAEEDYIGELESGATDFVLEVQKPVPRGCLVTSLGNFTPAVWMRSGHPLAKRDFGLEDMLEYPFVQYYLLLAGRVEAAMESRFDKLIARMGKNRRKAMVTNQLMTALDALHSSDCLMLATMDDLKQESEFYQIVRKPYPADLEHDPVIPAALVQHERTANSPMHNWIKDKILGIVQGIRAERDQERASKATA
ncbi:MAG TPA: LysR family transcriptional regulator [Porticoccaceae bacterium]|nr:LysR family transcriptional regulator [Porticoccaceae bacterium]